MTRSGVEGMPDPVTNNKINVMVKDRSFNVSFPELNTPVTVSVEIEVDTLTQKNSCNIKKCTEFDRNNVSASAKGFDFKHKRCYMTIEIYSAMYGKGQSDEMQVSYVDTDN